MGNARATRQSYASHARSLAAEWPDHGLDDITPDMVDAYFAGLVDRNMSKSLRAKRRTVLVMTYRRAIRAGLVKRDPTADIKPISQRQRRKKRPVTDEEFGWLVDETPAWLRPALYLSYDSGLRSGELCGLHWADVDLDGARAWIGPVMQDNGTIKNLPKNGQPEEVVLSPRTVELLRAYARRFPGNAGDLVIREPRAGGRMLVSPPRYRHLFYRSCRLASLDVPLPRPHDMRHGLGERLANAGVPIHVVQRMMRHNDVKSTQTYFPTVSLDDMRAAMATATAR
jgi:integrase